MRNVGTALGQRRAEFRLKNAMTEWHQKSNNGFIHRRDASSNVPENLWRGARGEFGRKFPKGPFAEANSNDAEGQASFINLSAARPFGP
jgi:hypothetical protein